MQNPIPSSPRPQMDREIELLCRVTVNYLFLGQLEPLRAALLSLRRRDPRLAAEILRTIVLRGGRVDGAICSSPTELAWLAVTELLRFDKVWDDWGLDRRLVKLKVEFLLLVEMVWRKALEREDHDAGDRLRWMLDWGTRMLSGGGDGEGVDEVVSGLKEVVLIESEVFDSLSRNLRSQVELRERGRSETVTQDSGENIEKPAEEIDQAMQISRHVQLAHLGALKDCLDNGDMGAAISHVRHLYLNSGVEDTEYMSVLQALVKEVYVAKTNTENSWNTIRKTMLRVYVEAISSGCLQLVQMIQVIQDKLVSDEIEQHRVSEDHAIPLPLLKFLNAQKSIQNENADVHSLQQSLSKHCITDMYHYARITGSHVLQTVMESSLSLVKTGHLQEASDMLDLFPLLQPLVAAMGWDLLSGKTELRRKMMNILWTSKSQALRLEEHSVYGKQPDEISCVEYLCDILCFRLDLASFVVCVNSGNIWYAKDPMIFSRKQCVEGLPTLNPSDSFVENFVLERLAVHTPLRVLFDVVPGIKFQDVIGLITMQPIYSTTMASKRMQDTELLHVRYALESAVISLGTMEVSSSERSENLHRRAMWQLKDLRIHVEAITNVPRKIFLLSILISVLQVDKFSIDSTQFVSSNYSSAWEQCDSIISYQGPNAVVSFISMILDIMHSSSSVSASMLGELSRSGEITSSARDALEWQISNIKSFVKDWEWRLSILQQLFPLSGQPWCWKEALTVLRVAPSSLLNLCLQKAKYDIGEETVCRFSLSEEDKAALRLSEWVMGASQRASVEDTVSRAAEGNVGAFQELNFSALQSQLGSLAAILLCVDIAATSARSLDICMRLLNNATSMLSEIYPRGTSKDVLSYCDQIQEVTMISVIRRILQRMLDLLEKEKTPTLREIFSGENFLLNPEEPGKQEQRERSLSMLQQMIDDAHLEKRQFLSGKLRNIARAFAEEENETNSMNPYTDKKISSGLVKATVLGLAFRPSKPTQVSSTETVPTSSAQDAKDTGKRFRGLLGSKSSTYLSTFIVYIAAVGDIVDGVDTTHDFNFFSLVYEWPKDILIRLVFERGSSNAAEKVADIMHADFVHEVISACVPPVFPPRSSQEWACIPTQSVFSRKFPDRSGSFLSPREAKARSVSFSTHEMPQYPLQLEIVKHLANSSPVRAILACIFSSGILVSGNSSSMAGPFGAEFVRAPDTERMFYEFALDQSEKFPPLKRWIQMQSNLHKTSAISRESDVSLNKPEAKVPLKRSREPESDTESDVDEIAASTPISAIREDPGLVDGTNPVSWPEFPLSSRGEPDSMAFLSLDWENERLYQQAVGRLIDEGQLMDALTISDRFLCSGASDQLLELLIEQGDGSSQESISGSYSFCNSWQYCLRLNDKQLAARLAIKYLHKWELDHAMDVLTMCSFHLPVDNPLRCEVLSRSQALQIYNHILSVDDGYNSWQEVEADCKQDPEGLALRLAGKGAVSAALEVAESATLSIDLKRELQGRQLVKLLTTDPLSGGGPAAASRFLSSLSDPDDALPVTMGAMHLLPDLRSKQLLVNFFLKRRVCTLSNFEVCKLNLWNLGLRVLATLPAPWQQKCSSLHENPPLILEVLLMMKQLQYASLVLKEFPSLRDDNLFLIYSAKAIATNANPVSTESRTSVSGSILRQKPRTSILSKSNLGSSSSNSQKETGRAFTWTSRDSGSEVDPKDTNRKRKSSGIMPLRGGSLEQMPDIHERHASGPTIEGQDRFPLLSVSQEWLLTGDPNKDDKVRSSHRYETSPDIVLFKGLLSLCSDELVSARGALTLCVSQMKTVLSSQQLPLHASLEATGRAYRSTETFVQALNYAKSLLQKLAGSSDLGSNSERSHDVDDAASVETSSSSASTQISDELSELQAQTDIWLGHAELLQSLLGSGIIASLDDIANHESSTHLRDRLIQDERYSMAVYTCKKCKIDAFPVWNAWGHALLRLEHYAQARIKFKQAIQLYKADCAPIISKIIDAIEGEPPVDFTAIRSMYQHLAKSASTIMDDSLSVAAYLNVLQFPSTVPHSEKSRRSVEFAKDQSSKWECIVGPHSNLDNVRYMECIYYLQEYARSLMLGFMFRHGHYFDACMLFFPLTDLSSPLQLSAHGAVSTSLHPQRLDSLTTDYGTIEDLCNICIDYGAVDVLEDLLSKKISLRQDAQVDQHISTALTRICSYFEAHRHFNYLYKFQVMKKDQFVAGLTCIQLFTNSTSLEEAIKHLENAKLHFDEALATRKWGGETRMVSTTVRGKTISGKLTEDGLVKFSTRVVLQVEVLRSFNNLVEPPWKHSLFGNPNDPETFMRRCTVAESLAERNFDLAFRVICEFCLPAVDIYAGVASFLAERKKSAQLMELFRNIKAFIDANEWDEVLGAAINTYAEKHKERHDRLIDMLNSSHRKVLACVVCGRLKSAFQIASRSGSIADVQYVAHQALQSNALQVLEMCRQWLAQYM